LTGRAFVAETPIDDPAMTGGMCDALGVAALKQQAPEAEKGFSMLTAALQKKLLYTKKREEENGERREEVRAKKSGARKSKTKKKRDRAAWRNSTHQRRNRGGSGYDPQKLK